MIIGAVIVLMGFASGFTSGNIDAMLNCAYILFGLAIVAVLFAALIIGGKNNPKGLVKALIGLVIVAALCFVVYMLSTSAPLVGYHGPAQSAQTLKLTSTLLNLCYILSAAAIIAIIIGEVVSASRNRS